MTRYKRNLYSLGFILIGTLCPAYGQSINTSLGGILSSPTEETLSSLIWNPAIIGTLKGTQIESNLALVGGHLNYERSGLDPNTDQNYSPSLLKLQAPNPFLGLSSDFGTSSFFASYSTYFPTGIKANFEEEGSQRYDVVQGLFLPWNHQLTLAYQINDEWIVGAGAIVSVAFYQSAIDIDLSPLLGQVLEIQNLPRESPALTSRVNFDLSTAMDATYTFGALYRPNEKWSFGASFFGPLEYHFYQSLDLETPPLVAALGAAPAALGLEEVIQNLAKTKRSVPAYLQSGLSYRPVSWFKSSLFGRYVFSSFARFTEVEVIESNLQVLRDLKIESTTPRDSYLISTTQKFSVTTKTNLGLNLSYYSNSVANQDLATSRIDFDSILVGAFTTYQWTKRFRIGAEYNHAFMISRQAVSSEKKNVSPLLYSASTNGTYEAALDRFALSINYVF